MTPDVPQSSLELRSLVTEAGTLELSLTDVELPALSPGQVLLRVEAAPINPSDLGLLLAGADMASASTGWDAGSSGGHAHHSPTVRSGP